jgi:uncharacterized damage-inducible protein DinB
MAIKRPDQSEFAPFYAGYIAKVPDSGPVPLLQQQIGELERLRALPDDKANHAYDTGKWTVKELIGHVADAERVFSYRLTRIARGDKTPLPGFDENAWARTAPHRKRPIAAVVDELIAIRRATLALVESLDESTMSNVGLANNNSISARAICWILAGHTKHHLDILAERYGVAR